MFPDFKFMVFGLVCYWSIVAMVWFLKNKQNYVERLQ